MTNQDFIYGGILEPARPEVPRETSEPKPRRPADIARDAATLCWRIKNAEPDPTKWRPLIDAADPELKECLRE